MSRHLGGSDGGRAPVNGVSGWRCPNCHSGRSGAVVSASTDRIPTTMSRAPAERLGARRVGRAPDSPCQRAHDVEVTRSGGEPNAHAPSGIRSRAVAPRCVSVVRAPSGWHDVPVPSESRREGTRRAPTHGVGAAVVGARLVQSCERE